MNIKHIINLFLVTIILFSCTSNYSLYKKELKERMVTHDATTETIALYDNLKKLSQNHVLFGHQAATEYGRGWSGDENRSDVKDATGSHPAVIGFDFNGFTHPGQSLESIEKEQKRLAHLISATYDRGGVVTISCHFQNPVKGESFMWDENSARAVEQIIPGGSHHEEYKEILNWIGKFANNVKGSDGKLVPMIFRPYHEFDGNWFWWGKDHCTREDFIALWRFTVGYLRDKLKVQNFIYAFSPDCTFNSEEQYLDRYPGDEWVDMVGVDDYSDFGRDAWGSLDAGIHKLKIVSNYAQKHNKLAAFNETGLESIPDTTWWTKTLLHALKDTGVKMSYVLVWRNDSQSPTHYYASPKGHPSYPNFLEFYNDPFTLFENDLPKMYVLRPAWKGLPTEPDAIDKSIAAMRMGELIVKTRIGDQVTIEQLSHQFWFGCAISNSAFDGSMSGDDLIQYKEKFVANFNAAVTENAVKWENMERVRGKVNYSLVDAILDWTTKNNIPLRGHNVFWGSGYIQPWIKELDNQELKRTLQNRAETLASRYKGRFAEYDLNNEMLHGNYYEDRLGPEITKWMAQWMHNGDPDANLFLNDYDISNGIKLNEYMAQIRNLLNQGVPIAGIGVQGHQHGETFDRYELNRVLDSLSIFNLPIRITEFNIPGQTSKYVGNSSLKMTKGEEAQSATELVDFYRICFAHPAVKGIILWGFWEKANWIPASSLYRTDWSATPKAEAYRNLVFGKWWTNESGKADRNGIYSTRAFYGKYKITIGNVSKIVDFDQASGSIEVDFTK